MVPRRKRPAMREGAVTTNIVNLWIGDSLGPIERACMRSVLRQGHRLALYCYRDVAGVPEGVEILDASAVLPESAFPADWATRSDLYSDWFRYEIQKRGLGIWLDLDIYLVAPLDLEAVHLFGEYEPGKVNGAVLRLPPDSPMLAALLEQFAPGVVPKALPWYRQAPIRARKLLTGNVDLSRTPWGTTGPHALTRFVRRFKLSSNALSPDVFYPAEWRNAAWIRDPAIHLDDMITERTVAVHLWNECIREFKSRPAPQGSFLARLQHEGRP